MSLPSTGVTSVSYQLFTLILGIKFRSFYQLRCLLIPECPRFLFFLKIFIIQKYVVLATSKAREKLTSCLLQQCLKGIHAQHCLLFILTACSQGDARPSSPWSYKDRQAESFSRYPSGSTAGDLGTPKLLIMPQSTVSQDCVTQNGPDHETSQECQEPRAVTQEAPCSAACGDILMTYYSGCH